MASGKSLNQYAADVLAHG
ncbi:MAG: hypothetical protein FWF31_12400 [Desulfobulbus sp.]|nr:hypothetical protein [Desulfobulbus sp.]